MTEGLQSKENRSQEFKIRLDKILDRKITVETIDSYMDRSVNELIDLTGEIVEEYQTKNPEAESTGKEIEDAAYEENGLSNIDVFLDVATSKIDRLNAIDDYISSRMKRKPEVITPPDAWEGFERTGGLYEKPDVKHRLKALLYVLQENGIDLESLTTVDGVMRENMMREESYVSITIPELDRLALICDEEGNASYMFDLKMLEAQEISVVDVERMTKEQKNTCIERNQRIGVRFVYSQNWMDRAEDFLLNELPEYKERKPRAIDPERISPDLEELPKASKMELDPWKGFWTDPETGKHWGNITSFAVRTDINRIVLERVCEKHAFETREIVGVSNRKVTAFCFEEVTANAEIKKYTHAFAIEEQGEWKGFHIDEEGNHWANQDELGERIGVSRDVIKRTIKKHELNKINIQKDSKRVVNAYCYEELIKDADIKEIISADRVEKVGEWRGFHIDKEGRHWAGLTNLSEKIGLGRDYFENLVSEKDSTFVPKKIKPLAGSPTDAYCYEDVINNPYIKEHLTMPGVEKTGEWKGFHIDKEGNHWGAPLVIATKLGLAWTLISRFIEEGNFETKEIRDLVGGKKPAVKFEDFIKNEEFQRFYTAPSAEKTGAWQGFYADEEGKHWGPIGAISKRIGIVRETLIKIIERSDEMKPKLIRDIVGRDNAAAYCYEDFANNKHVQDILAAPKVETQGEWRGFYTDKEGRHWANISSFVDKIGISYAVIERSINENDKTISLRGASGKYGEHGYCYEDIIEKEDIKEFLETPQTERDGEWNGFYIDKEGNHWGPITLLASRKDLSTRTVRTIIERNAVATQKIRGISGILDGYAFEDIERLKK